jgi:hypothetical protein
MDRNTFGYFIRRFSSPNCTDAFSTESKYIESDRVRQRARVIVAVTVALIGSTMIRVDGVILSNRERISGARRRDCLL